MKNILLIFSILLLLLFKAGNLNGQTYRSSLGLHYGLFQFNNAQNDFFFDADGNFLNAGLSYKYKLGRLSSLSFTGRYYDWNQNNGQTLNTQSLQSMWLIHAGRISSSWRLNLITPYIGAGIGYEMHTLTQNVSDRDFNNFYLPLEVGMYLNLGPRWSLGVFAEYKLDHASDLKNMLGLSDNYQGVVNAAGVTLSYHLGQRTTELAVPVVATKSSWFYPPDVKIEEESDEIIQIQDIYSEDQETEKDTLAIAERDKILEADSLIVEATDQVIVMEMIRTTLDTLRIPIVIDLTVKGLEEKTGPSMALKVDEQPESNALENKIDSLIRMTGALNQRIARLESTPAGQIAGREIQSVQPQVFSTQRQPQAVTTQGQPTFAQPAQSHFAASEPTSGLDGAISATKNDIETLRSEIRQLATDNREAMNSLRREIRGESIPDRRILENMDTEKPGLTEPIDTISEPVDALPEPADTLPEFEAEMAEVFALKDSLKPDEPESEYQAELDSLAKDERLLASELELLKQQNLELMEELTAVVITLEAEPMELDERIAMEYSVTFGVNAASLSDDQLNKIAEFATVLKDNPDLKIQLSGYADGTGDPEYNKLLSQWRVQAVRDELMRLGISQVRILEQYFGSENATGGLNPQDRRVDMRVL